MADESNKMESVQTFGRKKTAVAVAYCKKGRGLMKINGVPIELVKPEVLKLKVYEPILLLGSERFAGVDIRIRVKGGGYTSQIYAIRQAIAKAIVAYNQKYVDEASKREIKEILTAYDRSLLVADPRRCRRKRCQLSFRAPFVADPARALALWPPHALFPAHPLTVPSPCVCRCEAKKFGGPGARARRQKSYR